ncbi:MAG: class B sortase [Bacilli bacterium]
MELRTDYHKRKRRKRHVKKVVYIGVLIISIIVLVFSLLKIFIWNKDNSDVDKLQKDIADKNVKEVKADKDKTDNVNPPENKSDDYWDYIKMDMLSVDFNELKKKNPDTVGWIKVNGTNINYPVVQTKDNDYYLNHAYDKSKNSAGWIYADYRNNMTNFDKNTIIYGHGRLNNTMFGSLKTILNSKWYNNKNNYIIKFSTPTENTLWQVFSVYSIKAESYYITTKFSSDKEYDKFLQTLKNRSKKDFSATVNTKDKIITLSTCKDVAGTERVVMHAKLIKVEKR